MPLLLVLHTPGTLETHLFCSVATPTLACWPSPSTVLKTVIHDMRFLFNWMTSLPANFWLDLQLSFIRHVSASVLLKIFLYKEEKERPTGQYASFCGSIQLLAFLLCMYLKPRLLRGGPANPRRKPSTLRHSHFRKNKDAEQEKKIIMGYIHRTVRSTNYSV